MNEHSAELELSPTLVEMVQQGKCTLFAGPLISAAPFDCLGPPTPAWLAFEMAERMQIQPERYDLPWVAQLYADRESRNALRNWVAGRLADVRYCPTPSHHLVAQLPFPRIVYTAQDRLLRVAHENDHIQASLILPGGRLGYATQRTIVQLYGSAEQPDTLRLTDDERRRVWDDDSGLGEDLRSWARSNTLLFVGYTVNDPELLDLYYELRPQDPMEMPRSYVVGPGTTPDYIKYWEQHNSTLYPLNVEAFLQMLAKKLNMPVNPSSNGPPRLDEEERSQRDRLRARFEYLSHLNAYIETGAELPTIFEPHVMIQIRAGTGSPVNAEENNNASPLEQTELKSLNKLKDGTIEWSQGNLDLARVYFEEALRYNPDLTDAHLSLFHLLVEKRELDDALQVYQEMLQRTPQQAFLPERYQLQKILGQSNLGVSYRVFDREEKKTVTVTILRRTIVIHTEDMAQFTSRMSVISSPRISRTLDFKRYRGRTYMISEYFEGQSLRERLREAIPLPYTESMQIAAQVAEALEAGHHQGVPHLNLHPSNILLTAEGARLVSYGFSQLTNQTQPSIYADSGGGTDYLSPEQLAGQKGDPHSDIYALGTILYEMLTGHPPGVGSFQHPSEVNPQVNEAVDVLIDHARERYPDRRFSTVADMRTEINRITLVTLKGNFNQFLRVQLSSVSHLYELLASRKYLVFFILALAVLLGISMIKSPATLNAIALVLFPLMLNSLIVSILLDWAVRAVARLRGLGSLIPSGRGMGAILGLVFTVNIISTVWQDYIAQTSEITNNYGAMLAVILFEVVAAVLIILGVAWIADRWFNSYTSGFYSSFIAIFAIELVLTLLHQPKGLYYP